MTLPESVRNLTRVTEGDAVPLLQRLARISLGPGADFPPAALRDRPGFVTRITPRASRALGLGFRANRNCPGKWE